MSEDSKAKGFPDLSSKLTAPTKKSFFERQKAEAEAKRARERAETAAVYEDFVKSFEDNPDVPSRVPGGGRVGHGPSGPGSLGGGPAKRHFTSSSARNSGPGSLGPPPSLARKRTHNGLYRDRDRDRDTGILAFENSLDPASAFRTSDDEEEKTADDKDAERAVAKPTLYLSSLPPGTSPMVIKALIPPTLAVDGVKILPPTGQASTERKSFSAIVTLAKDTAGSDIDSAVSALQNKYLGWGLYLSISRHLSSIAINSNLPLNVGLSSTSSLPFGAKTISHGPVGRLNRAPPPTSHRAGFAPPASYGAQYGRAVSTAQIEVKPPSDLKQLRLIHKTLENLLNYGPEFEALLMSRPDVQKDEKWAWLWDPRSTGGVWYRWKLWDILTNPQANRRNEPVSSVIFEDGASWVSQGKPIRFEYTTQMDEFVSDEDYNSSEDDDSDMEDERRRLAADDPVSNEDGLRYMNPLETAKFTHLLARLPTANTRLRRGDVARVTAFAIEHAGQGAEEVAEMLVSNVLNPFAYTHANPERDDAHSALKESEVSKAEAGENATALQSSDEASRVSSKEKVDTSAAKLVGLYVISDILSSSSTSGVRHAWRYRQLFENAFRAHQVFEHLGRLEKDFSWGRLKADKWKRSVGTMLHLWEGWCVFPQSAQEHFVQVFEKPPLSEEELAEEKKKAETEKTSTVFGSKGKSRWKTVDEHAASGGKFDPSKPVDPSKVQRMDVDYDGKPMVDDMEGDSDGEPMSDIDGVPMEDSDLEDADFDGQPLEIKDEASDVQPHVENAQATSKEEVPSEPPRPVRRTRPKAEDMFADSDGEDA